MRECRPRQFTGAHGNRLEGEETGPAGGYPVVLLHGGGQTRHAWQETAGKLGGNGFRAIWVDQRGHGGSGWDPLGRYQCADFAADLACIARAVHTDTGHAPVVVGASLGGVAAMLVAGETSEDLLSGGILVDITPSINPDGVDRITGFMQAHAGEGFATVEEAADAVAAYLPNRPRPASGEGLLKNLRQADNGRYVWHWDPRFLAGPRSIDTMVPQTQRQLADATQRIDMPLLLVRGSRSELVQDSHVAEFIALAPHAEVADVRDAGHMVAGDRNDIFADAVIGFLQRHFANRPAK
jgi:pimeloyl-ACP methyl ester carboxylesterase